MRKHDTEIQQLKGELEEDRHNRKLTPNERVRKLHELQGLLVDSIMVDDLVWGWIGLKMGERRSSRTSDYRIEVCQPVRIAGLWVPVTAKQTWDLAYKFRGVHNLRCVPLTRAVFDQYFNAAVEEKTNVDASTVKQDPNKEIFDFELFSSKHRRTSYQAHDGSGAPVAGGHKLWLVSAHATNAKPVNYGFHRPGATPDQGKHGSYLFKGFTAINGLIRAHDWPHHWDYSQLLQFMRNLKNGQTPLSLRKILAQRGLDAEEKAALRAVWDEPGAPQPLKWTRGIPI